MAPDEPAIRAMTAASASWPPATSVRFRCCTAPREKTPPAQPEKREGSQFTTSRLDRHLLGAPPSAPQPAEATVMATARRRPPRRQPRARGGTAPARRTTCDVGSAPAQPPPAASLKRPPTFHVAVSTGGGLLKRGSRHRGCSAVGSGRRRGRECVGRWPRGRECAKSMDSRGLACRRVGGAVAEVFAAAGVRA
jgi:hypothetical protein